MHRKAAVRAEEETGAYPASFLEFTLLLLHPAKNTVVIIIPVNRVMTAVAASKIDIVVAIASPSRLLISIDICVLHPDLSLVGDLV